MSVHILPNGRSDINLGSHGGVCPGDIDPRESE